MLLEPRTGIKVGGSLHCDTVRLSAARIMGQVENVCALGFKNDENLGRYST